MPVGMLRKCFGEESVNLSVGTAGLEVDHGVRSGLSTPELPMNPRRLTHSSAGPEEPYLPVRARSVANNADVPPPTNHICCHFVIECSQLAHRGDACALRRLAPMVFMAVTRRRRFLALGGTASVLGIGLPLGHRAGVARCGTPIAEFGPIRSHSAWPPVTHGPTVSCCGPDSSPIQTTCTTAAGLSQRPYEVDWLVRDDIQHGRRGATVVPGRFPSWATPCTSPSRGSALVASTGTGSRAARG